jgi:DNA-binding response OmpR family regulator
MYSEADRTFMKILLIDDSRFLRISNERALTRAGHQVTTASDGEEGLRLAIDQRPDLIVLDMMLPKLSGPDVLHALRKSPATADIPVMVLTSLPQSNEGRLITEGATAYFEKSLLTLDKGSTQFVEAVEKMLKH